MTRPRRVALACAATALATSGAGVVASLAAKDWHVSALVRMSETESIAKIARGHDSGFVFVPPTSHYDGVYFYAIALDPLGRGDPASSIDRSAYRYSHAGYGWMAWAASLGQPPAVPAAMLVLGLLGVAVGAAAASLLANDLGFTPWTALIVAFNPGIVYAASVLTSETVGIALLMLGLLAWLRERRVLAAVVLTAACLTKEPFLLVPVALGAWELIRGIRARRAAWIRDPELWRRAALLLAGPLTFALWYVYLIVQFDVVPHAQAEDLTTWPLLGWVTSLQDAGKIGLGPYSFDQVQIATASVALVATAGAALLVGLVLAGRLRTAVSPVYAGLALVILCLEPLGVYYPKDLIREISMPVALLPFVFGRHHGVPETAGEPAWADIG